MAQQPDPKPAALPPQVAAAVTQQIRAELRAILPAVEKRLAERSPSGGGGLDRKEVTEIVMKFAGRIMTFLESDGMKAKIRELARETQAPPGVGREEVESLVVEAVALAVEDPGFKQTISQTTKELATETAKEHAREIVATAFKDPAVKKAIGTFAAGALGPRLAELAAGMKREDVIGMVARGVEGALGAFLESEALSQRVAVLVDQSVGGAGAVDAAKEAAKEALAGQEFVGYLAEAIDGRLQDFREDIAVRADAAIRERTSDLLHQDVFREALDEAVRESSAALRRELMDEAAAHIKRAEDRLADRAVAALRERMDEVLKAWLDSPAGRERLEQAAAGSGDQDDAHIQDLVEREVAARVEEFLESEVLAKRVAARVRKHLGGDAEAGGGAAAEATPPPGWGPMQIVARTGGLLGKVKRLKRGT